MNKSLLLIIVLFLFTGKSECQQLYFPPLTGNAWETTSPVSLGWCTDKIDSLMNFLEANHTKAFIVLKNGRIVLEHYFGSFTGDSSWYWASAGKSLTAFVIGIARQEGILSLNDSTSYYIGTGWTSCPPDKERMITVLNQLTMTTGLKDLVPDPNCTLPSCLIYQADAGTRWAYHTAPYTMLDKVLENASGKKFNQYFLTKVRSRIGMNGLWVKLGYDNVYASNARSMARFGLLILNHGIWNDDTLLADTSYFRKMTNSSQNLNPSYGYLWWLNGKSSYMLPRLQISFPGSWAPDAPPDMIAALGKNGQFINIIPGQQLVMVRMGEAPDTSNEVPMEFNNDIWRKLNSVICSQTSVKENPKPSRFILEQNYPNPFNPVTIINYHLPVSSQVELKIYDMLGREITELVNEEKPAGSYKVEFNTANHNLSNGVYFYRLSAANGNSLFTSTKKLILLK